jgi:hypothetical protein
MKRSTAWLNLRYTLPERVAIFRQGLERLGYTVQMGLPTGDPSGVMVTWNRIGAAHRAAQQFHAAGLPVLVTENAAWGNTFAGSNWYSLARNWHNTAGCFVVGDATRWDSLGIELAPWRTAGETVVLPQRGIGPPEVAMPREWAQRQQGRVRPHPGRGSAIPLEQDLAKAGKVVTWGSGAAVKALIWGIPVESHMPNWVGQQENTDESRLAMFRRLVWAQARWDEISSGEAFSRLLAA